MVFKQVLSGKKPWSEVQNDVAVVHCLMMGHTPSWSECEMLYDRHWRFIQHCWSQMEEWSAIEAIVITVQQFWNQFPQSQLLWDLWHYVWVFPLILLNINTRPLNTPSSSHLARFFISWVIMQRDWDKHWPMIHCHCKNNDSFIFYESCAITWYLIKKYPNQDTAGLISTNLKEEALFEQASSIKMSHFNSHVSTLVAEKVFKKKYVYIYFCMRNWSLIVVLQIPWWRTRPSQGHQVSSKGWGESQRVWSYLFKEQIPGWGSA